MPKLTEYEKEYKSPVVMLPLPAVKLIAPPFPASFKRDSEKEYKSPVILMSLAAVKLIAPP